MRIFGAVVLAALLTGAPQTLMSLLTRLSGEMHQVPSRDLRTVGAMNALLIVPAVEPSAGWTLDPVKIFPTHPRLDERLARLSTATRRMSRRTPTSRHDHPLALREHGRRVQNWCAKLVFLTGLAICGSLFTPWPDLGHTGRMLVVLVSFPALFIGFRGLGRALNGAAGLAYAAVGVTLTAVPALVFALGATSYLYALALNWA